MGTKEQVLVLIPQLRAEDIPDVQAALQAVVSNSGVRDAWDDAWEDWLLDGIVGFLVTQGLLNPFRPGRITKRISYKEYKIKSPGVRLQLDKWLMESGLSTRHRLQLSLLAAQCLWYFLRTNPFRNTSMMLSQIDKIPEAFEASFPGYVQGGLLRMVLQERKCRNQT